ncbi:response regulator transcription factor [Tissierella praeacuta]|uniref:response regulator transcription factor n=1 Tax=Tissierella praeacuta TaxID=43131 RepID=UPI00333EBBC0
MNYVGGELIIINNIIKDNEVKTMFKVLVVDDERAIADSIAYALKREYYNVDVAYDGEEALEKIKSFNPDVVVLDIMIPKYDGYEVCKRIEKNSHIGILMLTAKNDLVDKVIGLELGADDYLTKPFEMLELLARVKSLCRRINRIPFEPNSNNISIINLEGLNIDLIERIVQIDGKIVELKPKEFDLLVFLFENPRHVFSRDEILEKVWDMDYLGGTRTVDVHVQRIRKKLGRYGELIKTIARVGYKAVGNFDEI